MPRYTAEELWAAWRYARRDAADNFVFDVIDFEDVAHNLSRIVKRLEREINAGQYAPAPLLSVDVPKRPYSVRPGAIISLTDLIVLYALVHRLAPALDAELPPAVFSYRWLPAGQSPRRPLFSKAEGEAGNDDLSPFGGFSPYPPFADAAPAGWFRGWLEYHKRGKDSAARYDFCAVGDVTAYFENVSVSSLFDRIADLLGREYAEVVTRLRRLYEFWGWQPAGAAPRGKVLPQGNDISLFLSNFFLCDLDRAMDRFAGSDAQRYQRYVDDIRVFTDNLEDGRAALLACDRVLRDLSLSLNPEKTRVIPAAELFDPEVERWLDAMSPPRADAAVKACDFLEKHYDPDEPERWERAYLRALTTLQRADDDAAIPTALREFLANPSYKFLIKNFDYLSHFAPRHEFADAVAGRLGRPTFTFPYHKHLLYRLAAYGREDAPAIREMALHDARYGENEWYVRVAALFCLNSFNLSSAELDELKELAERESHPMAARAALVALRQRPVDDLTSAEDHVLLATSPGQTELREYFYRLSTEEELARLVLAEIRNTDLASRSFLNRLHQLDLIRNNAAVGEECRELLEQALDRCLPSWPRLHSRLRRLSELAAVDSLRRLKTRKITRAQQRLENVLGRSREAVVIADARGEIQVWNDAATRLLGYGRAETLGRDLTRILEPVYGFTSADELLAFVAESGGSLTEDAVPYRRRDGVSLTLSKTYSVISGAAGEAVGLSVLMRDVTAEIRAAKAERFHASAAKFLAEASARFVAPPDLEAAINHTLAETAALLAAHRAYLFRTREGVLPEAAPEIASPGALFRVGECTLLEVTHEAAAPEVAPLPALGHKIELSRLPLLKYQLVGRHVAVTGDAETLPPPEREELRRRGARAALGVPFHIGPRLAGFVGCDDVEGTRTWQPEEINLLRSVTALISKALERTEAEQALRLKSHDLVTRVKELNCLHTISKLAADADTSLDVIIRNAVEAVQRSWQYPEVACARVVIDGREFSAGPYLPAAAVASQTAAIEVRGKPVGLIEIGYCEERPELDEGPFLREERDLIDAVARRLGKIVEARRAEVALRKNEREKTSILETMAELVTFMNTDLDIIWANKAAAGYAGMPAEEMAGRRCYEVWYGRAEPCASCHVVRVTETGEPQELETSYTDGSVWEVKCSPVRDDAGELLGIVEVSLDITEQKRAESALRRRAEDLRAINDVAVELAALPSREDILRAAAERLRGITGALAVGITSYEADRKELRVRHLSASGKALAKTAKILGRSAYDIRTPVDDETYKEMLSYRAKRFEGLYELTLGGVPRAATEIIVKSLGIGEIYGAALHHGGELLGTAAVLTRRGREGPSLEILENFANVVAAALERKKAEEAIARRAEGFKIVNDLAIELAAAASTAEIYALTCRKLKDLTGAVAALTASYDEDADELVFNSVAAESKVLKRSTKILGRDVTKLRFPAERYAPSQMSSDRVVIFEGIPKKAYKVIPEKIGAVIEKTFNVGPVYELLLHHGGKLMGTAEVVMLRGSPPLSVDALETFAHVAAAALVNKQAEEAYRTSEERFKSLVDTMNEGFGIQDVDGVIAYVNDRFCDMVGYAREELVGRPATDFLDPPNARIMRDQTARREKSPGDNYDIVWTGKDGRRVHTIISPGALRDAEGRYVGTYATITDVTARKRAEERLKESEKRYKAIVKLAPDGITFVNPENVIVVASPTFAAALGYKPHELEGKSFAELMPPGEPPKGRAETGRRHQRRAAEYDVVLLHRDGSPKRLTLYSQPLTADDGGFVGTAKKIVAGP